MKQRAQLTTDRNAAARPPQQSGPRMLQRKCACGNGAGSGGSCGSCADEEKKKVQRRALDASEAEIPASVDRVLQSPGRPLDHDTRAAMESRFGHDFSRVRVHTDTHAASSAREIHAAAYTSGTHIVFGDRRFEPQTRDGRLLLAHELAHVVQQHGPSPVPIGVGPADDVHERAADRMANNVTGHGALFTPRPVMRQRDGEDAPRIVEDVLRAPGEPLDPRTRAAFEPRFGHDFGHVRVHDDDRAADSAAAVGARAYTVGPHIVLGAQGATQGLLAHELTHVVQQESAQVQAPLLQRSIGSFLLDILLFIPRLFGLEYFTDGQLREYLDGLRTRRGPQRSLFSDNMARACVSQENQFGPYNTDVKTWLVQDMLDGRVSFLDEGSIIALLRRSTDRAQIVANVGRPALWQKFTGRNRRILEALTLTASDANDALVERLRNLEPDELQDYTSNNDDPALREIFRRAAALHNITAPVPASAVVSPAGSATFQINGIDVTAEPDERSTDPAMGSSNITRIELRPVDQGQMFMDENHIVTEFRPLRYLPFVHTIWGPQTVTTDRSGYGRGTTSADVAAGNTSIRFHESRHAQNWFDYLRTHPIPQFTGRVGMTEDQFRQARTDLQTAVQRYTSEAQAWSHEVTDCVGTLPTAQQFREANVTSSAVTNAATLCRQGGGQ